MVDWWVGQYSAGFVEEWYTDGAYSGKDLSAPFALDYPGIPDAVLARSFYLMLVADEEELK